MLSNIRLFSKVVLFRKLLKCLRDLRIFFSYFPDFDILAALSMRSYMSIYSVAGFASGFILGPASNLLGMGLGKVLGYTTGGLRLLGANCVIHIQNVSEKHKTLIYQKIEELRDRDMYRFGVFGSIISGAYLVNLLNDSDFSLGMKAAVLTTSIYFSSKERNKIAIPLGLGIGILGTVMISPPGGIMLGGLTTYYINKKMRESRRD